MGGQIHETMDLTRPDPDLICPQAVHGSFLPVPRARRSAREGRRGLPRCPPPYRAVSSVSRRRRRWPWLRLDDSSFLDHGTTSSPRVGPLKPIFPCSPDVQAKAPERRICRAGVASIAPGGRRRVPTQNDVIIFTGAASPGDVRILERGQKKSWTRAAFPKRSGTGRSISSVPRDTSSGPEADPFFEGGARPSLEAVRREVD